MLRYLAHGSRDFAGSPILVMTRFNWEFYANLGGALRPMQAHRERGELQTEPTLWLFPPDSPHGWEAKGVVERAVFHFSSVPEVIREACRERGYLSVRLAPADVELLRDLSRDLAGHYRSPTAASLLHFDRALIDLSLLFLRGKDFRAALPLEAVAVERVQRVIDWYLMHLPERPDLKTLAAVVHVSPAHLRRQFQLVHGQSPHRVLTRLRLERVAQLLANTGDTLEAIARCSGFNSASDLCRVFKNGYKVYPNEWRMRLAGQEKPEQSRERLLVRMGTKD